MPAPKNNKHAAHPVPADVRLHVRCNLSDRQRWAAAASRDDLPLSRWVSEQLNEAARRDLTAPQFNAEHTVGDRFLFNGRQVVTRSEAYEAGSMITVVRIKGRQAGVDISQLRAL